MSFKLANTSFISIAKNSALAAPQASDFKHECIRDSQSIEGDSAVWLLSNITNVTIYDYRDHG